MNIPTLMIQVIWEFCKIIIMISIMYRLLCKWYNFYFFIFFILILVDLYFFLIKKSGSKVHLSLNLDALFFFFVSFLSHEKKIN